MKSWGQEQMVGGCRLAAERHWCSLNTWTGVRKLLWEYFPDLFLFWHQWNREDLGWIQCLGMQFLFSHTEKKSRSRTSDWWAGLDEITGGILADNLDVLKTFHVFIHHFSVEFSRNFCVVLKANLSFVWELRCSAYKKHLSVYNFSRNIYCKS